MTLNEIERLLNEPLARPESVIISTNLVRQLLDVARAAKEYCFEPQFDTECRDVILNRRHNNFKKLVCMIHALEATDKKDLE